MLDSSRRYEMVVRPLNRKTADEYLHNGDIWIEGREGNSYTIDLTNRSNERKLFILSVDGVSVLDGKPAGLESEGYVLNPNQSVSVPGWLVDDKTAAEFYFGNKKESYANTVVNRSSANIGVIGAMVFSEKVHWPSYWNTHLYVPPVTTGVPYDPRSYGLTLNGSNSQPWADIPIGSGRLGAVGPTSQLAQSSASVADVNVASAIGLTSNSVASNKSYLSQDVGTGFGEAVDWSTTKVTFEKATPNSPDAILAIYYNTARNLEKMGIRLRRRNDVAYKANPFPSASNTTSGCIPPPGWVKR